jgi:hypothetical protein
MPAFYIIKYIGIFLFVVLFASCKKEITYIYEVNDVNVSQTDINKENTKSVVEFISIAYSDIFGTTISQKDLEELSSTYDSFGDLKLMEDLIVRNFLNQSNSIPSDQEMRADIDEFVKDTYHKLLNRDPNEFESWYLNDLIENDADITPELVYYGILTSDEYRTY